MHPGAVHKWPLSPMVLVYTAQMPVDQSSNTHSWYVLQLLTDVEVLFNRRAACQAISRHQQATSRCCQADSQAMGHQQLITHVHDSAQISAEIAGIAQEKHCLWGSCKALMSDAPGPTTGKFQARQRVLLWWLATLLCSPILPPLGQEYRLAVSIAAAAAARAFGCSKTPSSDIVPVTEPTSLLRTTALCEAPTVQLTLPPAAPVGDAAADQLTQSFSIPHHWESHAAINHSSFLSSNIHCSSTASSNRSRGSWCSSGSFASLGIACTCCVS